MAEPAWSPPAEFEEYRIVRLLGRGAMGQVYLAHDDLLDRPVALKFVLAQEPDARARFFDEARAIARLQHPNVVAIYRVAEIARHPYLVSEFVRGRTLDQLDRPVPWRQVLDLALDLARGLAAAHRCGVLHRDVKPANAMLTDDGRAKLLDFGLARVTEGGLEEERAVDPPRERAASRPARATGPGPRAASPGPRVAHLAAIEETLPARDPEPRAAPRAAPRSESRSESGAESGLEPRAVLEKLDGENLSYSFPRLTISDTSSVPTRSPRPSGAGTPLYMAPEVWRGEPATRRSDLYSLGILLYELLTGTAPHRGIPMAELGDIVQAHDIPRLGDVAPDVDPALAAIVDRLVERDAGARYAAADALLVALEEVAAPPSRAGLPDGNPYRGLAAFDSAHGPLFFGRRKEIRELVDRVRAEAFVVVAGDSGTGKSSLCRAGALPWLAEHDGWTCVDVIPGRHPVRSFAAAVAGLIGGDEIELAGVLRVTPEAFARAIRQSHTAGAPGRRLLLFVDQLEELLTLSEPDEARAVAAALSALAVRTPSLRVLASCRSDFLSRVAMLPGLGDEMARGLYFLPPLTGERIREVIVRPAAAKGVSFESEELIDALVQQTEHAPGGLPLLQFTLAELWDTHEPEAKLIRAASLAALGGVGGALTRHADRLLSGLRTDERDAARRLLLRLVTAEETRARRSEAELLGHGERRAVERQALEVLVRGRVVVANDAEDGAYEIAHEALLTSWSTLRGWLQRGAADHAARARVEQAAAAWERMGRARDLLWGRRQLGEVRTLDRDSLAPREVAFLAASGKAALRRRLAGAGGAAALAVGAVAVGLVLRARAQAELDALVDEQLRQAAAAHDEARERARERDALRARAFAAFDAHDWGRGEAIWSDAEKQVSGEELQYRGASSHLESALLLDPAREGLREQFAELTFERLLRAERDRRGDLVDELGGRLAAYDSGRYRARLDAHARVALDVSPPGTRVSIERPGVAPRSLGLAPLAPMALTPGSVIFSFEAPGHIPARLPVLLAREEQLALRIALPAGEALPDMLYVPAGRFLFGSADGSDARRGFLNAAPLHEVATGGYFIGAHEVTFAAWIAYLDDLPPEERRRRTPSSVSSPFSLTLAELGPRRWRFELAQATRTYTAETGQPLRYEGRDRRAEQDFTRFPVSAVSYEDAIAYTRWLDRTGRMRGARLCDEYEWERAARGADARLFPTGPSLAPDDANIDATYGRQPLAFGPDAVGAHPGSRSPVGADDMAGNVWEWTRSVETPDAPISRGGAWYNAAPSARSMNREYSEPTARHPMVGLRLCCSAH